MSAENKKSAKIRSEVVNVDFWLAYSSEIRRNTVYQSTVDRWGNVDFSLLQVLGLSNMINVPG